jgi:hypothetical protein
MPFDEYDQIGNDTGTLKVHSPFAIGFMIVDPSKTLGIDIETY